MLVIPSGLEKQIRIAGETAYPDECCGILIGEVDSGGSKIVKRTEAVNNAREEGEKRHRFLITPEDILHAERIARAARLEIMGFYHSHPDHPASPSEYDKDHALPFYSYAIVSVEGGRSKELRSWELSPDRANFLPEKIGLYINNMEDA